MNMEQKTICIVYCDKTTLPILDYIDSRSFTTLALSKGIILWNHKGLGMLIPPERIANTARVMEAFNKQDFNKVKWPKIEFTFDDTIKLPSKIAMVLLGSE